MKITIDTKVKRISLDEEIKLSELFDLLEEVLPDTYSNYTIGTNQVDHPKTSNSGEETFYCDNKGTVPDLGNENGRWYKSKDEII